MTRGSSERHATGRFLTQSPIKPAVWQVIEFEIPGRPPNTNANNRAVQGQRWRERRQWRDGASSYADQAMRAWERARGQDWRKLRVARLDVTFIVPTKRGYDWDNLVSTLKPLLDGIVDAGLIADDSIFVLPHVYTHFEYVKGVTATRFEISEPIDSGYEPGPG